MTVQDEIRRQQHAVSMIQARLRTLLTLAWGNLGSYNDADVNRWLALAVPVVLAAQRHVATVTDAYLARVLAQITGEPTRPVGLAVAAVTGAAVRNGTEMADVYRRPFVALWTALKNGQDWSQALQSGLNRATSTGQVDVVLSQRAAMVQVAQADPRIVGYRRTLTGQSCGLCAMASTQRYGSSDLMPIHNHCDCGVAPIIGSHDPGQVINRPLYEHLRELQKQARAEGQRAPKDANSERTQLSHFTVHDHGELGPVLTVAGQNFTGPADIAA